MQNIHIHSLQIDRAFIAFTVGLVAVALAGIAALSSDDPKMAVGNPVPPAELLARQAAAYESFLERNNFHQIRISEYERYWGDASSDQKLGMILDNIRQEREFLGRFDFATQAGSEWSEIRDGFRQANERAVDALVEVLLAEYDHQLLQVPPDSSPAVIQAAASLAAQREVASQITATSFPAVTGDVAELAHVPQLGTGAHGQYAVSATENLEERTEANVKILEENGIDTRQRHDVMEVGPDKNTMQVLYSVIRCQQELRINAEDYMDATLAISQY